MQTSMSWQGCRNRGARGAAAPFSLILGGGGGGGGGCPPFTVAIYSDKYWYLPFYVPHTLRLLLIFVFELYL